MEQMKCNDISNDISHIYYRSYIKSCNYSCYYCPFHKHKSSTATIEKDKRKLFQFIDYMEKSTKNIKTIVFTPYGEILIYQYYWKELARLSRLNGIRGIGCQTNLSFDIDAMVKIFLEAGGELKKLRLWCTFHPTMVSIETFSSSIDKLIEYNIKFCVGAVADVDWLSDIIKLHEKLDSAVPMWINRMEGRKRKYTKEEINQIKSIDPFFEFDLNGKRADYSLCKGGKQSVFVDSCGDVYACNISRKKLFHLYDNSYNESLYYRLNTENQCFSQKCDCYLSYSLRKDIPEMVKFFPDPPFRIPLSNLISETIKVIFFDIDGTLAAKDGSFNRGVDSPFVVEFIRNLSKKYNIFVATSLPYVNAMKKCSQIKEYLSGGVFAGGAYIKDFNTNHCEVFPILDNVAALILENGEFKQYHIRFYRKNNVVYKITLVPKSFMGSLQDRLYSVQESEEKLWNEIRDRCNIVLEDGIITLVDINVSKTNGILKICSKLEIDIGNVAAIGDSVLDYDMMEKFSFSN